MTALPAKAVGKLFEELEAITKELDGDELDLDVCLKKFERGLVIASELKKRLQEVEQKVETIKKKFEFDE